MPASLPLLPCGPESLEEKASENSSSPVSEAGTRLKVLGREWHLDTLQNHSKSWTNSAAPDWDLSRTFCVARSSSQEFKPSADHDRWISHRASPEKEAEEMENRYEEEPVSKFPASVFETEEDIHQSNHSRTSQPHNQKQGKLLCSLGNSRQEVLYSSDDIWEENKCPNGGWATLYISTGLKGTWTKVSITVCNRMGSLGLSIAGGKGSTPYKINDDGIFISKVLKGGAADLAGLRVGDMMLEVNGISLQNVTHQEAVHALRNSGTVIKILILRNGDVTTDTKEVPTLRGSDTYTTPPDWNERPNAEALALEDAYPEKRTCNGRNLGSVTSMNRSINSAHRTSQKRSSFRAVNHSMPLPRIVLTRPSTSDEELEQLALEKDEFCPARSKSPEVIDYSDYLNNAFYPP